MKKVQLIPAGGKVIDAEVVKREGAKGFTISPVDRFRSRTRYFCDSGIIGSKEFVRRYLEMFCGDDERDKRILPVAGLDRIFSLKRLSERF